MGYQVGKYTLDREQTEVVLNDAKHLLVVAGAGSGKTLTILGKIKYLIEEKNINPKEIICISFTDKASSDLKRKIKEDINLDLDVYTFHKLGLEILKNYQTFEIADSLLLEDLINLFFMEDIYKHKDALELVRRYFNLKSIDKYKIFYEKNYLDIKNLEKLLSTFLRLFKANAYDYLDFLSFLDDAKQTLNIKKYKREKILLSLAINIYTRYENYLKSNSEIDFDDMLIKSKKVVDQFGFMRHIKYIIIDEYQDTSMVRFNLIKSILNKTDASLVAVGDDFQSIYRFTGCDLELFLNFKKIFADGVVLKIQNTYRNSVELISAAGKFVMKNKSQMKKRLRSSKRLAKPFAIKFYDNPKREFESLINYVYNQSHEEILILGRNNKDINFYIDSELFQLNEDSLIYKENRSIKMKYMTTHKSKGLEAPNTIIINLKDDTLGFPNKMTDDKLLRFVSPHSSKIPYDEERRLFYVAITRTKNITYLLVPRHNKSSFIEELEHDNKDKFIYL